MRERRGRVCVCLFEGQLCGCVGGWVFEFDSQKCQKLVTDVLILIMMGFLFKGSLVLFWKLKFQIQFGFFSLTQAVKFD